jgi:hypothetical protein
VAINSTGGPRIATRYSHHSHNRSGENRPQPRPENFVYAEWIMLHDNPDFRGFVDFLRGELDRSAPRRRFLCGAEHDPSSQISGFRRVLQNLGLLK